MAGTRTTRLELLAGGEITLGELVRALAQDSGLDPGGARGCGGTLDWWRTAVARYTAARDLQRLRALDGCDRERRIA